MTPDEIRRAQRRLGVTEDGVAGPVTYAALFRYVGRRANGVVDELGRGAAAHFPKYAITTPLRVAHWMGQMAHESAGFFYLKELGGESYFFRMYDKAGNRPQVAKALGNTEPGDGARYAGRGIIQLTGRLNYRKAGQMLGLDLEGEPELAADPENAVLIACNYWSGHKINALADADNLEAVTRAINGGLRGLEDRRMYTLRAKGVLL